MIGTEVRIGTRGSVLAMIQARLVAASVEEAGLRPHLVVVETDGDRRAPDSSWGEGVFVAAIERELLAGRIDMAVHSAKDLPTTIDARLRIAAYLPRADPRDALVIRSGLGTSLDDLKIGARVGTDSPRRTGFVLARRPDLSLRPLHGNVDTRLQRLDAGGAEALVLACAGLDRLGLAGRISERLDPSTVPPAPGQGAIAVQVRWDDAEIADLAALIDDPGTRLAVEAERAFLAACGGGCRSPIGALATLHDGVLDLRVGRVAVDGSDPRFARLEGSPAETARLIPDLAASVSRSTMVRAGISGAGPRARVIVTRPASEAMSLIEALRDVALEPIAVPAIAVEIGSPQGRLDAELRRVGDYGWVVVTSGNGARAVLQAAARVLAPLEMTRWAVVGSQTRRILEEAGVDVAFQPAEPTADAIAAQLPVAPDEPVLVVRGTLGSEDLPATLIARGAVVHEVVAYATVEAPASSRGLLAAALKPGPVSAIVFTSGSTVRGLLELARVDRIDITGAPAVCIGPETAASAAAAGFNVVGVAATPEPGAIAEATALAVREPSGQSAPPLALGAPPE